MTAKEYLQEKYPTLAGEKWNANPHINDNWVAKMMEEYGEYYARLMIEKDRIKLTKILPVARNVFEQTEITLD